MSTSKGKEVLLKKIHDGGRKSIGQQEIWNVFSQTERESFRGGTDAEHRGWQGLRETIRIRDSAMRRHRSYISSRGPTFSVLRLSGPRTSSVFSHGRTRGTKAASFEGGSETKRVPTNTACNRVNCAAYAFISLFRDNLLIVSTKRDNPLVDRPGRFFGSCEGDAAVGAAQKGSICMRVNAPPFLSPFLTTLTM